jgi:hypothetical protein
MIIRECVHGSDGVKSGLSKRTTVEGGHEFAVITASIHLLSAHHCRPIPSLCEVVCRDRGG